LYTPLFYSLYRYRWITSDYMHAYFILPIFFWLLLRKYAVLKNGFLKYCPANNFIGLCIFVIGVSMFVFGWRKDCTFITTLSLIPVLYGLTYYLYGMHVAKITVFPILYLMLLVPIPIGIIDDLTIPVRNGISIATEEILKYFHYPITRNGLLLSIDNNELFMGQTCSGFRSLITMFSLALVYAYISKIGAYKKAILVSVIIPFSIFGNLVRVITLCLITYHFGETVGQGFFHYFSGILIFVMVITGLLMLEGLLGRRVQHANIS